MVWWDHTGSVQTTAFQIRNLRRKFEIATRDDKASTWVRGLLTSPGQCYLLIAYLLILLVMVYLRSLLNQVLLKIVLQRGPKAPFYTS